MREKKRTLFVTVGTTSFDALVRVVSTPNFTSLAQKFGYSHLVIQYGRGEYIPFQKITNHNNNTITDDNDDDSIRIKKNSSIECEAYRFKPSLADDMNESSLIISHAGAGSIMEALYAFKPCIVVVNEDLMDNHQTELAGALEKRGYLICLSDPKELLSSDDVNNNDDDDCGGGGGAVGDMASGRFVPKKFVMDRRTDDADQKEECEFADLLDGQMGFIPLDGSSSSSSCRNGKTKGE